MGVAQSVGSLSRVLGPIIAGALFAAFGRNSPFLWGAVLVVGGAADRLAAAARCRRAVAPRRAEAGRSRRMSAPGAPHEPARRPHGRPLVDAGLPEPDERLGEGLRALKGLAPYLWPRDSLELRVRVVLALVLLLAGKLVNIYVPLFYKHAVDALSIRPQSRPDRRAGRADPRLWRARGSCRRASTSCATPSSPRSASARCAGSRWRCSATCMRCRCAFTSSAGPAAWRATSSAARRASSSCCRSCCSTSCRRCSRSRWSARSCGGSTTGASPRSRWRRSSSTSPSPSSITEWRIRFRREMNERDTEANTRRSTACSTTRPSSTSTTRSTRRGATTERCRPTSAPRSRARRRWPCSTSARARSSPSG